MVLVFAGVKVSYISVNSKSLLKGNKKREKIALLPLV
jgi:hypothetical protein